MGFSRQEYWSELLFPPPVDHVLSELFTMTHLSWVVLQGMAHSFIELHKLFHHDRAVIHAVGHGIFSSIQLLSRVRLFATPWTPARQASLSITNTRSPPKPVSINSLMPSNHLILCHPFVFYAPSVWPYPNRRVAILLCSIESLSTLLFCH